MANKYWIGNSGNWSDPSHWSLSSGGTWDASMPTYLDSAYFDASSFDSISTVTINVNASCYSIDFSELDASVTLTNTTYSLSIFGDVSLHQNLNWNFTSTGSVHLKATDGSHYITTNGSNPKFNILYIDGSGGSWINQDDFCYPGTTTGYGLITVNYYKGNWFTNDKTISVLSINIYSGNKIFNLGSSEIITSFWNATQPQGLTFICGTSTIRTYRREQVCGNLSYYNYVIEHAGNGYIAGNNSFVNLYIKGTHSDPKIQLAGNNVITGVLSISGSNDSTSRLFFYSNSLTSVRALIASDVSAANVDFQDVSVGGTAIWDLSNISGGSGNCGGNRGITFTSSTSCYFVHTSGACAWSDINKWKTASGGDVSTRIPLSQDSIIFDENSFTGASIFSAQTIKTGNIDMKNVNQNILINTEIDSFGESIKLNEKISFGNVYFIYSGNRNPSLYIESNNANFWIFYTKTGFCKIILQSNMTARFQITGIRSGFDANGYDVSTSIIGFTSGYSCYFGSGTWTIGTMSLGGSIFIPQTSTIIMTATGSPVYLGCIYDYFEFNKVILQESSSNCTILGSHSFKELIIESGRTLSVTAGTTQTIDKLIAIGRSDSSITITSPTSASHNLIFNGTGYVQGNNLNVKYSNATPLNKWYAGKNSSDGGNNTGWLFKNYALSPHSNTNTFII